jgi:hypothetical protein
MKARFFLILMFIIPLGTVCSLHAQNNIAESQWVGNNTPIKVTSFNNAKEGQYTLTLNLFTNTYNTKAKMNAVVDLNTNSIQVTEYSHFASKNKNDAIIGSGSSEVTTKSDAYCKFKLYLSNNTLYLEQIMNPGGPAGKLRLNPSSWEKMKNQGDIAQSQWVGNNTPIKVTTFNNAKEGQYTLTLNLFTNTYNTRAKMNAVVDLNTNSIQVTEYSHFASKNKNDAVIGSGSSEVTTKSDAYCKFKLYLSNNTLYLEQIMNPGGPAGKLRLNPSSWEKMKNQGDIAQSQWVGNNTPIKVTTFNNGKEGQYTLTLNLFTNTYNTKAKMNAVVDLNTNSIQVTEYSHFASKNKNDAVIGSGSSEVTTKSDAYCKFKLYLSNNTLYLEQIMNPGGPAGKLRLNPSSWKKQSLSSNNLSGVLGKEINIQNISTEKYLTIEKSQAVETNTRTFRKDQAFFLGSFKDRSIGILHDGEVLRFNPNSLKFFFMEYEDRLASSSKFELIPLNNKNEFRIKAKGTNRLLTDDNGTLALEPPKENDTGSQSWKISDADLRNERSNNDVSYNIAEDSSPGIKEHEMLESFLFEELQPAIERLKDSSIIQPNVLSDKSQFGNITRNLGLSSDEEQYYLAFKRAYKETYSSGTYSVDFELDFQKSDPSFLSKLSTVQDYPYKLGYISIDEIRAYTTLMQKISMIVYQRDEVTNKFNELDKILELWREQADLDVNSLFLNMSLEDESQVEAPPNWYDIILGLAAIPANFDPYGVSGAIISTVDLSATIADEVNKNSFTNLNSKGNNLKETVSDLKQEYFNASKDIRRALSSYRKIILSDPILLAETHEKFYSIDFDIKGDAILNDLTRVTKKSLFKNLLPIKGILVGYSPPTPSSGINGRYSEEKKKSMREAAKKAEIDRKENLHTSLNPIAHIAYESFRCEYTVGRNTFSKEKDFFWQIKISGSDPNSYTNLGEGGDCGLTELRQLWDPKDIYSWLAESKYFDQGFFDSGERDVISPSKGCETSFEKNEIIFSPITPETFKLNKNEAFIEVIIESFELVNVGEDPSDDLEVFGSIAPTLVPSGLTSEQLQAVKGFDPSVLWSVSESDEIVLEEGAGPKPVDHSRYIIKISDMDAFGEADPTPTLIIGFYLYEADNSPNPDDFLSCTDCVNELLPMPFLFPIINLQEVLKDGIKKYSVTLKESKQEIRVNFSLRAIFNLGD